MAGKDNTLEYKTKNIWDKRKDKNFNKKVNDFNEKYKDFLSENKTEREVIEASIKELEVNGFKNINEVKNKEEKKLYYVSRNRNLAAFVVGKNNDIKEGVNIVMSHVDAPRLDFKPKPLYEDEEMALMQTHYYGGIKKYQWTTIPLALKGVIVLESGEVVNIDIGDRDDDPVFSISDILPHLGKKQMEKTLKEAIVAEDLNILIGSTPYDVKDKKFKQQILELLYKDYGIKEEDFISADLHAVPAGKARDLGFDRSMISAYAHDDRVCVYTSLQAILDTKNPAKTSMMLLIDREEVGSEGNTGAKGRFVENALMELMRYLGEDINLIDLQNIFDKTHALSADVDALFDPNYKEPMDPENSARLNHGIIITKYTGSGGKYLSSEASPEFVADLRKLFNTNDVDWQIGMLGKVDEGGGGTIAMYLAERGIEVVDSGPGVLSMHAPCEVVGKADVYASYNAYKVFMEKFK